MREVGEETKSGLPIDGSGYVGPLFFSARGVGKLYVCDGLLSGDFVDCEIHRSNLPSGNKPGISMRPGNPN